MTLSSEFPSKGKADVGRTSPVGREPPAAAPESGISTHEPVRRAAPIYHRILVPVDGSVTAERGLREAIRVAGDQGAQLRVIYVLSAAHLNALLLGGIYTAEVLQHVRTDGEAIVNAAVAQARNEGITAESGMIEHSGPQVGEAIVAEAQGWHADLIVMGTHGRRGLDRAVLGSDAEYVLRHACTPVLLVRA